MKEKIKNTNMVTNRREPEKMISKQEIKPKTENSPHFDLFIELNQKIKNAAFKKGLEKSLPSISKLALTNEPLKKSEIGLIVDFAEDAINTYQNERNIRMTERWQEVLDIANQKQISLPNEILPKSFENMIKKTCV